MRELRAGIIGYGLAGRTFHAPLIAATPGISVAAVVTSDPGRRAAARAELPGAALLASAEELWSRAGAELALDLVVVASSNESHAPLAARGLEAGLAVVVDKPLAVSSAEAEGLVRLARERAGRLTVFQNRRWDRDFLTLRRVLEEGTLGEVTRFESSFTRWRPEPDPGKWREQAPPERGGGQLLDLGAHLIDQALLLFGPVTHVYAEVAARRGTAGDDDAFVALHHAGGVVSHLTASALTAAPGPRLRVQGTRGGFVASATDPQEQALRKGRRPDRDRDWGRGEEWESARLVAGERSVPIAPEPGNWPRFYALLEEALRSGGPPPVDPADAVRVLELIEAARLSSAQRRVVALPPAGA